MNWEMCEVFPTRKAGSSHLCMQGTAETYKGSPVDGGGAVAGGTQIPTLGMLNDGRALA